MSGDQSVAELRERVEVDRVDLAWGSWGPEDAPTLMLCHGFSGSAADFDLHTSALVDAGLRVVLMEHRGHGRSGWGSPSDYSVRRLTDDLAGLLDRVAPGKVHLLGHSMGGRIALELALEQPDLIASLVLMDTSAWSFASTDPDEAALVADFFRGYDPSSGLPGFQSSGPEDTMIARRTPPEWQRSRDSLRSRLDPAAFKSLGVELFADGVEPITRLDSIACPITVMVGSEDAPYRDQAPTLVERLGNARLHVFDGAHHSPQLTHQREWREAVLAHLRWAGGIAEGGRA